MRPSSSRAPHLTSCFCTYVPHNIFRLAKQFDVDFHVDFFDEPQHLHVRYIAEKTIYHGWQGRVAVGHLTEPAALVPEEQDPIIAALHDAGIGVVVLPATDMYLMGRRDVRNIRRGLAPIKRLLAAGSRWLRHPTTCETPSPRWAPPISR